jgi:hypothetical protein
LVRLRHSSVNAYAVEVTLYTNVTGQPGTIFLRFHHQLSLVGASEVTGIGYVQRSEKGDAALSPCNPSVTLDDGTRVIKPRSASSRRIFLTGNDLAVLNVPAPVSVPPLFSDS